MIQTLLSVLGFKRHRLFNKKLKKFFKNIFLTKQSTQTGKL